MNSVKTTLPSLRHIQWRTLKTETNRISQILPYISTNTISELNDLIYAGAKLECEKIEVPSKSTKKQCKPGLEVRLETQIKNLPKQAKMVKQNDPRICGKRMEKTTREKITVQLEEINQKVLAEEGRLKRYRQRVKQYRQNRTIQNNERKFYQQFGEHDTKTYQQPDPRETERFWTKIWQPKKHNENAEWINERYDKRTRRTRGRPKNENRHRITQKDTKKYIKLENARTWWNTWILVQETHLHSRQTRTRNEQLPTRCTSIRLDDQRKNHIDPKGPT